MNDDEVTSLLGCGRLQQRNETVVAQFAEQSAAFDHELHALGGKA
jgi:hypothetical protein